jgi:hypothetical protein
MLILAPGVAQAKNYCISGFPASVWLLVGQTFSVPAKGKCKPWTGFNPADAENAPSVGVGCTSSDGANFTLNVSTSFVTAQFTEIDVVRLSLPSQTGGAFAEVLNLGNPGTINTFVVDSGVVGAPCTTSSIPAAVTGTEAEPARNGDNEVVR